MKLLYQLPSFDLDRSGRMASRDARHLPGLLNYRREPRYLSPTNHWFLVGEDSARYALEDARLQPDFFEDVIVPFTAVAAPQWLAATGHPGLAELHFPQSERTQLEDSQNPPKHNSESASQ